MTEEQAKYRSECGTVVYVQFPARHLLVDGPGSEAEYLVTKEAWAKPKPNNLLMLKPDLAYEDDRPSSSRHKEPGTEDGRVC